MIKKASFLLVGASFLFVDDVNTHDEEWLGSSTMNVHGRAVRDFASLSNCQQMITEPIHIDGGLSQELCELGAGERRCESSQLE